MGRIQSDVGLATGLDIKKTVDQLMALQARSKTRLEARQKTVTATLGAVTEVTAITLGVQLALRRLKSTSLFDQQTATSTDSKVLTATASGDVPKGDYVFTAVQQASTQRLRSAGFAASTTAVGAGTFSFRFGGFVDQPQALDDLNGGAGVERGYIRITDRSGDVADIDLRGAVTVQDVVTAINNADEVNVRAEIVGDAIKLTDQTGSTSSNLKVEEVGGKTTAADLGLGGINVAANSATGDDVLELFSGLQLNRLNDGNGLSIREGVADLQVTFRDGSSPLTIDFHKPAHAAQNASATTTAANGVHAQVKVTADTVGGDYDGIEILFTDTGAVTAGNETVTYDSNAKTLTIDIDAGATTADDVISAINSDPTASPLFTAARGTGGNGSGLIALADTATTADGAAANATNEATLGELLATINAASPSRLQATIVGDRIEFTDLTTNNGGTFSVASTAAGTLAEDLGLGTATGATITSGRLLGGLQSTLLRSLNGGNGLGELGDLDITNRNGASTTVDLSGAETLEDVITAINAAGAGVTAGYNSARNGLVLTDTSGGVGNLIIANGDATNSADKLNIDVNAAVASVNSGSLNKQVVSESTLLSSLNGGKGVGLSTIVIQDAAGTTKSLQLASLQPETVGDVVAAVNALNFTVTARLNEAGDGILLVDASGGTGTLTVSDNGSGTAAKDLRLAGSGVAATVDGQPRQVINGSTTTTITLDADDTLAELVTKINNSGANVTASIVIGGNGSLRHRLQIASGASGERGALLWDGSLAGTLGFEQTAAARDAVLLVGGDEDTVGTVLTSSTNSFKDVVDGLNVSLVGTSTSAVTVTVKANVDSVRSAIQLFVDQYNKLRGKLDTLDYFDEATQSKGLLFGSPEALRFNGDVPQGLTGQYFGLGRFRSVAEMGVTIDKDGQLDFDSAKFAERLEDNPEDVVKFFTDEKIGFVKKMDDRFERIVGRDRSLLINRATALNTQSEQNAARINYLQQRLDVSRERLLNQFYRMELAVGKIQSNLTYISTLQNVASQAATSRR